MEGGGGKSALPGEQTAQARAGGKAGVWRGFLQQRHRAPPGKGLGRKGFGRKRWARLWDVDLKKFKKLTNKLSWKKLRVNKSGFLIVQSFLIPPKIYILLGSLKTFLIGPKRDMGLSFFIQGLSFQDHLKVKSFVFILTPLVILIKDS